MANRYSTYTEFRAVDKMTGPIRKMETSVGRFSKKLGSVSKGSQKLAQGMGRVTSGIKSGIMGAVGTVGALGFAIHNVMKTGVEFEQTLVGATSKFAGNIQKGSEEFKRIKKAIQAVGATTEFTANEAGQAVQFMAMAGLDAQTAIKALPNVIDLATAAQLDVGRATDIATDSLGAYNVMGKTAAETQKNLAMVSDKMMLTTIRANTSMEDLFEAIKFGAPVARAAGTSISEFNAMVGTLANAGIKGSAAGTGLRAMFTKLTKQTPKATKFLKKLGIQVKDTQGNFLPMAKIMKQFNKSFDAKNLGKFDKLTILQEVFGKIGGTTAINLLNNVDALEKLTAELENAGGTTEELARKNRDTLQTSLKLLGSAVDGVKMKIFDMNSGPLKGIIDNVTAWINANDKLISQKIGEAIAKIFESLVFVVDNIEQVWFWVSKIGMGIGIFWGLSFAVNAFSTAVQALEILMTIAKGMRALAVATGLFNTALLVSPIGIFLGICLAVVGAVWAIYEAMDAVFGIDKTIKGFFGIEDAPDTENQEQAVKKMQRDQMMVSPGERVAGYMKNFGVQKSEVTIRPDIGTSAEISSGNFAPNVSLQQSGGMFD